MQVGPLPPVPPISPADFAPWATLPPQVIVVISAIAIAGMTVLGLAFIRMIGRHLERRRQAGTTPLGDGLQAEVTQLRAQVESLEEPVEFTERLLARQRESERLRASGA